MRAITHGRAFLYAAVLGAAAALVAGAVFGGVAFALVAPAVWLPACFAVAWFIADGRSEQDFWTSFATSIGMRYVGDHELMPLTPLLGAGDRRSCEHWCAGERIGMGLYRFQTRHKDSKGNTRWENDDFTVCAIDLPAPMQLFPHVFLRERRMLRRLAGEEWLRWGTTDEIELESVEFDKRYDLRVGKEQDAVQLRELFAPAFIDWLTRQPFDVQFEYSAGTLCVYLDGHHEDAGTLVGLLDAAREVARRIQAEVEEEWAAGKRFYSEGSSPASS